MMTDPPLVAADAPTSPVEETTPRQKTIDDKTCPKCGKVMQSRTALHLHLKRVYPCDLQKPERVDGKKLWDRYGTKSCHKCNKTFTTSGGLRLHLLKTVPCDAPTTKQRAKVHKCEKCQGVFSTAQSLRKHKSRIMSCDGSGRIGPGWGSKTCPKCNATFTTGQGLRCHLSRVTPCDVETPSVSERGKTRIFPTGATEEENVVTCPRCQRLFTTEHGLHIHMGRKASCIPAKTGQDAHLKPVDSSGKAESTSTITQAAASVNESESEANSVTNDDETLLPADKTMNEGSGRVEKQINQHDCQESAIQGSLHRKRSADRSDVDLCSVEKASKRSCNEFGPLAAKVLTDSPKLVISSAPEAHSGDILTDGCCCRRCVRKWTLDMMLRLENLKTEVESLRSVTSNVKITPQDYANSMSVASSLSDDARKSESVVAKQTVQNISVNSSVRSSFLTESPEKVSLLVNYNHLNDQIIINEKALEDSSTYLKNIPDHDEATSLELRSQINELRVYINAAKGKRDAAVAAILAHRWKPSQSEFRLLLETMTATSRVDAERMFHEECGEIARQLTDIDKVLSMDVKEIKSGSEMSEYNVQQSAKQLLERERDAIFMRLLRSSHRIYLLTRRAFTKHPGYESKHVKE